jgi:hypothetical protein
MKAPGALLEETRMNDLDRTGLIQHLDDLGAESDESALQAARAVHALVNASGMTWDDILRPQSDLVAAAAPNDNIAGPTVDHSPADASASGALSAVETAEAGRLIDRLLARAGLSKAMRDDLGEMKGGLADGTFEASDLRYLRALAKRLGG